MQLNIYDDYSSYRSIRITKYISISINIYLPIEYLSLNIIKNNRFRYTVNEYQIFFDDKQYNGIYFLYYERGNILKFSRRIKYNQSSFLLLLDKNSNIDYKHIFNMKIILKLIFVSTSDKFYSINKNIIYNLKNFNGFKNYQLNNYIL